MSLYNSFAKDLHLLELASPMDLGGGNQYTPTQRRDMAMQNLTGNGSVAAADVATAAIALVTDSAALALFGASVGSLATGAPAGITAGVGALYASSVEKVGGIFYTRIAIDLTGLASSTTDLDIIGVSTPAAHIGQITAAESGTLLGGRVFCFETPAGGADDIDLYSAVEGTGAFDAGVASTLTETALLTRGAAWAAGDLKVMTGLPAANEYLYLVGGEAGTAATYTAGRFLIELIGV